MADARNRIRSRSPRAPRRHAPAARHDARRRRRIPAGEFKAICLRLMEQVRETGEEFVITKRGRPVAKLGPVTESDLRPFVGRSRGVITAARQDLLASLGADWEVDADL